MHPPDIKQEIGYLSPNEIITEVGDEKIMVFQEGGDVPLWKTTQERVATKFSQYDDTQLKDKKKSELIGNLNSAGVDISVVKGKRVGYMQDISRKNRSR